MIGPRPFTLQSAFAARRPRVLAASLVAVAVVVMSLGGCAPSVSVSYERASEAFIERNESVLTGDGLSESTRQVLRRFALDHEWRSGSRTEVIDRVRAIDEGDPTNATAAPLAELLIARGERLASRGGADASVFLDAAHAAFRKLRHDLTGAGGALDGRTAFAADLYNRAVSRVVTLTQADWPAPPAHLDIAGEAGWFRLYIEQDTDPALWPADYFDSFRSAYEVRVDGMRNHHRIDAFGAPLVAVRENSEARAEREPFMPPEGMIYPATAVIEFQASPGMGVVDASVRLCRPDVSRYTVIGGRRVLLSEDLTAPLAVLFSRTELGEEGLKGLTEVEDLVERIGVYMHEPYDPERIPVLFVHGLRSSPITWRDVLNDLRADPAIRERYQFWMFLYPTGLPVPRAAAFLRAELGELRDTLDPGRAHPGPREMVVVGHSMGGLLTKTLTHDPGLVVWDAIHTGPIEAFEGPEAMFDELREVFFYERDPDVRRVVFVATPHRGADLATSLVGSIGRSLIELPEFMQAFMDDYGRRNAHLLRDRFREIDGGVPTSIHNLEPDSPTLAAYNELGVGVVHHSIMGDRGRPDASPRSDGVVTYGSSRLESAASEVVVPAGHNAHAHPLAIEELRRILRLHLEELDAAREDGAGQGAGPAG